MNDTPSPFAPFQLPTATPAAETKPNKAPRKPRKDRSDPEGGIPGRNEPQAAAAAPVAPVKPERKKREKKSGLKAHSPKFELQAILAVAATLNEDDFPLFEKLVMQFDEMGKPARERILAAIGKVFG